MSASAPSTVRRALRTRIVEPAAAPRSTGADAAGLAPFLVDLAEAARLLALAPRTVRRLAASGLPYVRAGRCLRFRPDDLRAWTDQHVVGPASTTPFPPARGRRAVP